MDNEAIVDVETRSTVKLAKVGASRYAEHPTTDVRCVALALDDGPVRLWFPGDPLPAEVTEATLWIAHNAYFERCIFRHILVPRYGWPDIPIESWRCTLAMALVMGLPGKLERLGEALNLEHRKGNAAIMRKSRKPRKDEDPNVIYWHEDQKSLEKLGQYCCPDVATEREAYRRLTPLIEAEQRLWFLDQHINDRRFYTDGALIEAGIRAASADDLTAAFRELTQLDSFDQVPKLREWLAGHDCVVPNLKKKTLEKVLKRDDLSPEARQVIEMRLDSAHAAADKPLALQAWRNADGRVRGALQYHGTRTGRWAGRGPQPQNIRRESDETDAKIAAVLSGDADRVRTFGAAAEVVGDVARGIICAAPGHRLLIGDSSGIESRVLAWIAGEQSKLEQWARFDRTQDLNEHPHMTGGRAIGHADDTAYAHGKVYDLAFGYAGGPGAYRNFAAPGDTSTETEIKQKQQAWRARHPRKQQFWNNTNRAAIMAVQKPGAVMRIGKIRFCADEQSLRIKLPSGRYLSYPFPRLTKDGFDRDVVVFKDNAKSLVTSYQRR
jgi:DNA polymerase